MASKSKQALKSVINIIELIINILIYYQSLRFVLEHQMALNFRPISIALAFALVPLMKLLMLNWDFWLSAMTSLTVIVLMVATFLIIIRPAHIALDPAQRNQLQFKTKTKLHINQEIQEPKCLRLQPPRRKAHDPFFCIRKVFGKLNFKLLHYNSKYSQWIH